jgi:hypothetical protein
MNPSAALRARRFDVPLGGRILRVEPRIGDRCRDRHQELQRGDTEPHDASTKTHGA